MNDTREFVEMETNQYLPQIFEDITAEREYQNTRWGTEFDSKNTCNDWLTYIVRYAADAVTMPWNPQHFRQKMVKAAALCCAAIEWFDRVGGKMPKRHYDT